LPDGVNQVGSTTTHYNHRDANGNLLYLYYYQHNWHGDVESFVNADGSGGNYRILYGAWGEWYGGGMDYGWNGAWGYLASPRAFNFDANDVLDIGLYYAHGRWYNQDTGLFLSPDEKGEYLYGSGQDTVNYAWRIPVSSVRPTQPSQVNARVYYLNQIGNLRGTIRPNPNPDDLDGYIIF